MQETLFSLSDVLLVGSCAMRLGLLRAQIKRRHENPGTKSYSAAGPARCLRKADFSAVTGT